MNICVLGSESRKKVTGTGGEKSRRDAFRKKSRDDDDDDVLLNNQQPITLKSSYAEKNSWTRVITDIQTQHHTTQTMYVFLV